MHDEGSFEMALHARLAAQVVLKETQAVLRVQ